MQEVIQLIKHISKTPLWQSKAGTTRCNIGKQRKYERHQHTTKLLVNKVKNRLFS